MKDLGEDVRRRIGAITHKICVANCLKMPKIRLLAVGFLTRTGFCVIIKRTT